MSAPVATSRSLFDRYTAAEGVYDELQSTQGGIRPHWQSVIAAFEREPAEELARRWDHASRIVHENGITYNAFNDAADSGRPWEVDLLPLVLPAGDWERLSAGITQRARLLREILHDIYGPQKLLSTGGLPPEVVYGHPSYIRPFRHLPIDIDQRLMFFGVELARSPEGRWWAMADRTESPAGAGYALENRIVISRTWPNLIHECNVRRLAPFFMRLQQSLAALAPRATENPRVVLLTAGTSNPYYFEDVYLARYLGYALVEGGDIAVRDDCVFIKTLDGLLQVDVIFSRVGESTLDPLEVRTSSSNGAAGLLQAIRKENVAIANAPGCGFVESPVIMAFLPQLCRTLLGEELRLPSIATWWCGNPAACKYVLSHLDRLVIKPAFQHSGGEEVIGESLTKGEATELASRIREQPADFIAQEQVARSSTPIWKADSFKTGHVALRTFATFQGDRFEAMPGALVRVAASSGPMELSISAGDGSKDAWILSDGPVEDMSLLPTTDQVPNLRRNSPQLPSRVADNLFWLGRHLDRAEISARLLRVIVDRLSGERDSHEIPELTALVRVLAVAGQIEPDYAVDGLDQRLPEIEQRLPTAIFDADEKRSLRSTVSEIAKLAWTVRDRLSHDTWRAINRIDEGFYPIGQDATRVPLDESLTRLNQLIIDLAVCSGLISDGMVRGPAWRFLDMGRRIERTHLTCNLILEIMPGDVAPPPNVLNAVLDVMDLQVTYRSRYLAAIRPAPVLDLLIADETNPRSLIAQVIELGRHVDELPVDRQHVGLTGEQKALARALHDLQTSDLCELVGHGEDGAAEDESEASISTLLERQKGAMQELATLLSRHYLVHSGAPRRMQDEVALEP